MAPGGHAVSWEDQVPRPPVWGPDGRRHGDSVVLAAQVTVPFAEAPAEPGACSRRDPSPHSVWDPEISPETTMLAAASAFPSAVPAGVQAGTDRDNRALQAPST